MTTDMESLQPPAFEAVNNVELVSEKDSKILSVSVYSGRAEVVRLFTFNVKTGQNQVVITGLPSALDRDSLRVEGRGSATIHDVSISTIEAPPAPTTSPKLKELQAELTKVTKALSRAQKAASSVDAYLADLHAEHVDVSKLQNIVDNYDLTAEKLDDKITQLQDRQSELEKEVEGEKKQLSGPQVNEKLNLKASIGVFADFEGEVEIALIYAVYNATWTATYDIRVDMQKKDKPVTLIYKGTITQSTGEDWTDVPIGLETAAPTFGVEIPSINRWTLSVYRPQVAKVMYKRSAAPLGGSGTFSGSRNRRSSPQPEANIAERLREQSAHFLSQDADDLLTHRALEVSSKGNISATFSVPGLMTIPSDGVAHNVTIVKLNLNADMEWVSVPKVEAKVHLKAIVKNQSEYTLLHGPASVYVDGSFIARTDVPSVSPDETFNCPLGLDPSIRVTYPPVTKKVTQSGFMTRSRVYTFNQRITIHNTKSSPAKNVNIIDQVPVSEDATIIVRLLSPPLHLPERAAEASGTTKLVAGTGAALGSGNTVENKLGVKVPAPVTVAEGVTVQWDGVDEIANEVDVDELGSEGKLAWCCNVPAQGKVNLSLQWEVSAPIKTTISGL